LKATCLSWRYSEEHEEVTTSKPGIAEGSKRVCDVSNNGKTEAEVSAIGHLIAATREMMEALEFHNQKPVHPLSTIFGENPSNENPKTMMMYKSEIRKWNEKFKKLKDKALLKAKP